MDDDSIGCRPAPTGRELAALTLLALGGCLLMVVSLVIGIKIRIWE